MSGAIVYAAAHWLVWNDPVYLRVFWSPFGRVATMAYSIERHVGLCWLSASGFFLGLCVALVHTWRWLLLPVGLLLFGLGVFILIGFLS
jgi:hypothetical protein